MWPAVDHISVVSLHFNLYYCFTLNNDILLLLQIYVSPGNRINNNNKNSTILFPRVKFGIQEKEKWEEEVEVDTLQRLPLLALLHKHKPFIRLIKYMMKIALYRVFLKSHSNIGSTRVEFQFKTSQ